MKLFIFVCMLVFSFVASPIQSGASSSSFIDNLKKSNSDDMVFNVRKYGAKGDGKTDDSKAFLQAWHDACSSTRPSIVYVPQQTFLINQVMFRGPCKNHITMQVNGKLVASTDSSIWKAQDKMYWVQFWGINGLTIEEGILDGRGDSWWGKVNRKLGNKGPPSLIFTSTTNTILRKITSINSKKVHIVLDDCQNVEIQEVTIQAPGSSPNTDGIHIGRSQNIRIQDIHVGTGDDCISLGSGSTNITIDSVTCGPGHGISVGSLGEHHEMAAVKNITVNGVSFVRTQNGARIKTWPGGRGFAKDITFENIKMKKVINPIIIDQYYFSNYNSSKGESGVKISNVVYKNITGTSASEVVFNFLCSESVPCKGITVEDVKLTYKNGDGDDQFLCRSAQVTAIDVNDVKMAKCMNH